MDEFQPSPSLTIQDLDTLKILADPLRHQLLELLTRQRLTVKQMSARLGLAPGRLYYHVNLLEKHGLIQVVHTQLVSGIQEKHYRASALDYEVDRSLLSSASDQGRESIHSLLSASLDATREDMQRSLEARLQELEQGAPMQPRNMILSRHQSTLTEAQVQEFQARLLALTQEIERAGEVPRDAGEPVQPYGLLVAFYPSFYYSEGAGQDRSTAEGEPE